ncbi:MAG: hypothetical protein RIQ89_472 [Bacteroidota bacterium]|jgi:hypothetical protein
MALLPVKKDMAGGHGPLSKADLLRLHQSVLSAIPLDSGEYFLSPSNCKGCHGFDPMGQAMVDGNGLDVNLYDDWETSMMGLSGYDPLWRAKVSHEVLVNPGHGDELQNFCTGCHAPAGHYSAFYKGQGPYTLNHVKIDSLGMTGVNCHSCHAIKDSNTLGSLFNGLIPFDTNRFVYGPFFNPMQGPMQLYTGLEPAYSAHVSEGKFCSPCHTLISNTVDLNGNYTGGTFVEQATYHEWLNSSYPAQAITCQTCHMPEIEDPVKIAVGYIGLPGRSPFNLHTFSGANSFMVNLIKQNKNSLGITAPDANFDSTLAAINQLLTTQTLTVANALDSITADSAFLSVTLTNRAGHKFPSGYPARRAVLQYIVTKANGDTLFASGLFDQNYEVANIDTQYERHYQVINNPAQAQIYEMVMGDVNGNRTTVLERSASHLKDNRIPPAGFTTTHYTYDTTVIAGHAATDPDFNRNAAIEGTGKDIVHFHIPLNNYTGSINISASVYYQAVPPGWLVEMDDFSSAEIDSFLTMFQNADRNPVLIAQDTLNNVLNTTSISNVHTRPTITLLANPTYGEYVTYSTNDPVKSIKVYDPTGKLIGYYNTPELLHSNIIYLKPAKGIYLAVFETGNGIVTKKILHL